MVQLNIYIFDQIKILLERISTLIQTNTPVSHITVITGKFSKEILIYPA